MKFKLFCLFFLTLTIALMSGCCCDHGRGAYQAYSSYPTYYTPTVEYQLPYDATSGTYFYGYGDGHRSNGVRGEYGVRNFAPTRQILVAPRVAIPNQSRW